MAIDWMPTFANITKSKLSQNKIDGKNIWPLLSGEARSKTPHKKLYFYYRVNELHSIRMNEWKIQFQGLTNHLMEEGGKDGVPVKYDMNLIENNELYNLSSDQEEKRLMFMIGFLKLQKKWKN